MRTIKLLCSTFFLTVFVLFTGNALGGMPGFNPNQMQDLQKELEEANRAIEEYVASLPPEEQAEFNKAVEEISQMFDSMSEEEFAAFLNEMFTEEPMPEAAYEPFMAEPTTVAPVVEAPVLTSEQKKKVENIIKILDDVIRQTNIFLVQISSSLEASNSIDEWGKQGKIQYWQPGAEWDNLKIDIENFVQKLYKIQEKDLTTKEYKYLADLIEDEATINNLIQLQTSLNSAVPQIEISELDIQKLSSKTKKALKKVLEFYTEGLYITNIPKSLDAVIEKHEPKATKAKEAEEAAEKKALEAQKRPRTPAAATSAGASDEGRYAYDSGYGYGYDSYGYDTGYTPYESPYGYYGGDYGYDYGKEPESKAGATEGGAGGRATGGAGAGITPSGVAQPTVQKEVVVGPPAQKSPQIKSSVNDIIDGMKDITKIINENDNLVTIDTHLKATEEESSVEADIVNAIASLNKKCSVLKGDVEQLQRFMKTANPNTQARYNQDLNAGIEKSIDTLKTFNDSIKSLDYPKNKTVIQSPLKQWAYFQGDDKVVEAIKKNVTDGEEKLADLKGKIKERVSLETLQESITELLKAFDDLKKNTAQEIQKRIVTESAPQQPAQTTSPATEEASVE